TASRPARTTPSSSGSSKSMPPTLIAGSASFSCSSQEGNRVVGEVEHGLREHAEDDRGGGRDGEGSRSGTAWYDDNRAIGERLGEEHQHDDADAEERRHRARDRTDDDERGGSAGDRGR